MPQLKELDLSYNQLGTLHAESFNSLALRKLDLSNNKLKEIGLSIYSQRSLEELVLENNDIRGKRDEFWCYRRSLVFFVHLVIPFELAVKCPSLHTLLISGNPQRAIRANVLGRGSAGILEYMRKMLRPQVESRREEQTKTATETETEIKKKTVDNSEELESLIRQITQKEDFLDESASSLSKAKSYALKKELAMLRARKKRLERSIQA